MKNMPFIDEAQVLQVLRGLNPWWASGAVPDFLALPVRRLAFHEVASWMENRDVHRAVIITGARRVGKTTILYQAAQELIGQGFPPSRILYASFDHPILKVTALQDVIDVFVNNVSATRDDIVLLLDEVHYAGDWSLWLKRLVDERATVRIIATGSASLDIGAGSVESGVGRWVEVRVPTLSFYEYALLQGLETPVLGGDLRPTGLSKLSPSERNEIAAKLAHLEPHFHRYLLVGGFPETARMEDLSLAQRLLRDDVVDRVLKRDMTALFNVRNVLDLERLFIYLCLNSGGILVQENLAREFGVSRPTIANDLKYLEMAHLVFRLDRIGKGIRPRPKVYLADSGVRNSVLLRGQEVLTNPDEMGLIVETAVIKHLSAFYYPQKPEIGYWRGTKDREVDVIVRRPGSWEILVEVKYRNNPEMDRESGLLQYAKDALAPIGLVITKSAKDFGPVAGISEREFRPFMVPAYIFLYLLGHAEQGGHRRKVR
mgnify:CR=1 FL=1